MVYNLIADAGSTKTDWALTDSNGVETERFSTPGLNALLAGKADIESHINELKAKLPAEARICSVRYYGAGCATPVICDRLASEFKAGLGCDDVLVASDLLGAARSLLGDKRGIACILGTGSNSCLYNGNVIERNIPSLGFILGDEGSGAALGKRLVADVFKGHLPAPVRERFMNRFNLTVGDILDKVYREPAPNRFLASLVPFIAENIWNPYVYAMVRREFETFLKRNVSPYEGSRRLPICFTGSIAFHFTDILRKAASSAGFRIGTITAQPLDGLVEYHKNKND